MSKPYGLGKYVKRGSRFSIYWDLPHLQPLYKFWGLSYTTFCGKLVNPYTYIRAVQNSYTYWLTPMGWR